jgi:hypothetical protein
MMKRTEWKLEDHIKTEANLVMFLMCAVEEVKVPHQPTKKEMQWLKIACNDFVRIAKQKGWVD